MSSRRSKVQGVPSAMEEEGEQCIGDHSPYKPPIQRAEDLKEEAWADVPQNRLTPTGLEK